MFHRHYSPQGRTVQNGSSAKNSDLYSVGDYWLESTPDSNPAGWAFSWFLSVSSGKFLDISLNYATNSSFHVNHPTILLYTVWVTDGVSK
jgi:hypothetical protein